MTASPINKSQRATFAEFERLCATVAVPVITGFGFQPDKVEHYSLLFQKQYRKEGTRLSISYDVRDDDLDVTFYDDPEDPAGHSLQFICDYLGRPYEQYLQGPEVAFEDRFQALALLMAEQLSDVLSGQFPFKFTRGDALALLGKWRAAEHAFLERLEMLLAPRGYLRRSEPEAYWAVNHCSFRCERRNGWVALELHIRTYYQGSDIDADLRISFDTGELKPLSADSTQAESLKSKDDDLQLSLGYLFPHADNRYRALFLDKKNASAEVAQRLFENFVEYGEPLFARITTREQLQNFYRERFRR